MAKAVIVCGSVGSIYQDKNCDYIGVDKGYFFLKQLNIKPKFVIGDFDSYDFQDEEVPIFRFSKHKDETDLELALAKIYDDYDEIIICRGLYGRLDHEYYNYRLLQHFPKAILYDKNAIVKVLIKGKYQINKQHQYFSFFALENSVVSLEGFEYPLNKSNLNALSLKTISNKVIDDKAYITIHEGSVLCMEVSEVR